VAIIALSPGVVHTDMLESCFGDSASVYPSPDQWFELLLLPSYLKICLCYDKKKLILDFS